MSGDEPIPIARPLMPPRRAFEKVMRELWRTRRLSNFGRYSQLLERRGGRAIAHAAPLAVSSCDIGMVLAWRALAVPQGEVILPSFTFCSTANALLWNGLEPVFADIDPRTLCLDPDDVRRRIGPRTVGIAAVHAFGCPAAVDELEAIARQHRLRSFSTPPPDLALALEADAWAHVAMPRSSASAAPNSSAPAKGGSRHFVIHRSPNVSAPCVATDFSAITTVATLVLMARSPN